MIGVRGGEKEKGVHRKGIKAPTNDTLLLRDPLSIITHCLGSIKERSSKDLRRQAGIPFWALQNGPNHSYLFLTS